MGLENDLMITNGQATIKVNGHEYFVYVTEMTQRLGEPTELTAQEVEPWCRRRKTRNRMNFYTPQIDQVIFNDPATIVFWADGTKTVVKAQDEKFDPEKGLAMAISRKALGDKGNYFDEFEKWLPEKKEEEVSLGGIDGFIESMKQLNKQCEEFIKTMPEPFPWTSRKAPDYDKGCINCKFGGLDPTSDPCINCNNFNHWELE